VLVLGQEDRRGLEAVATPLDAGAVIEATNSPCQSSPLAEEAGHCKRRIDASRLWSAQEPLVKLLAYPRTSLDAVNDEPLSEFGKVVLR
jgi:hypothetical protein